MRKSMFRTVLLVGACLASSVIVLAQTTPRADPQHADLKFGALDVAIVYNSVVGQTEMQSRFWMYGGSVQFHDRFSRNYGVVADFSMAKASYMSTCGVGLTLQTFTFGPRYTYPLPKRKTEIYVQGLAGYVRGLSSVFPGFVGSTATAGSFAANVGGGVNVQLAKSLSLRAVEASWLRTDLPSNDGGGQNNLRLGSGLVFHF